MKYTTYNEAKAAANFENMGRDYGTAVVVEKDGQFLVKII